MASQLGPAVRGAVPDSIPVTVKIRIGWADASGIVDIARAAEQGGGSWLTIHGRTRKQLYKPPVDWAAIGQAREAVGMAVVANGDLFGVDALLRCAQVSGCRAFMVGRGAMGRPELFAQARGWQEQALSSPAMYELIDTVIVNSGTYTNVSRRYVETALRQTGLRPDEIFLADGRARSTADRERFAMRQRQIDQAASSSR